MKLKLNFFHKLTAFCFFLVLLRFIKTGYPAFVFLLWNLFLAYLPVFFVKQIKNNSGQARKIIWLSVSILFLPNAPYILTDLFHLRKNATVPLWFDLVLILSFALLGLIYFLIATERILLFSKELIRSKFNFLIKPVLFLASGYGIYLGRFLRFNSWDISRIPFTWQIR